MAKADEELLEELRRKDKLTLEISDAIDVRASIVLLLTTFLATEAAAFLEVHSAGASHFIAVSEVTVLVVSLAAAILSLWPRTYVYPDPDSLRARIAELRDFYMSEGSGLFEEYVTDQILDDQANWCRRRVKINLRNNATKNFWLNFAFYSATTALAMAICGLIANR